MSTVNTMKVMLAFRLDQSMIAHPIAFVIDISTDVSVSPFGRAAFMTPKGNQPEDPIHKYWTTACFPWLITDTTQNGNGVAQPEYKECGSYGTGILAIA